MIILLLIIIIIITIIIMTMKFIKRGTDKYILIFMRPSITTTITIQGCKLLVILVKHSFTF